MGSTSVRFYLRAFLTSGEVWRPCWRGPAFCMVRGSEVGKAAGVSFNFGVGVCFCLFVYARSGDKECNRSGLASRGAARARPARRPSTHTSSCGQSVFRQEHAKIHKQHKLSWGL